eukprot:8902295-Alexandrium_andersonii.AAC.1
MRRRCGSHPQVLESPPWHVGWGARGLGPEAPAVQPKPLGAQLRGRSCPPEVGPPPLSAREPRPAA